MKLSIIVPVYNVEKYNLYGIYCDLSPKERHASETKAAMALHRRELKELFKRGRLSFKSLCRAGMFYFAPRLYKRIRDARTNVIK